MGNYDLFLLSILPQADLTTLAAFSNSFLDNAALTQILIVGLAPSVAACNSCSQTLFARVNRTPLLSASSTTSCNNRS